MPAKSKTDVVAILCACLGALALGVIGRPLVAGQCVDEPRDVIEIAVKLRHRLLCLEEALCDERRKIAVRIAVVGVILLTSKLDLLLCGLNLELDSGLSLLSTKL